MRLFIALNVSKEIESYIVDIQTRIKKLAFLSSSRLTYPGEFHLTLKFLGDVSDDQIRAVTEKLGSIKFSSFTVALSELGFFPNSRNPRVSWISVQPETDILALQKLIDAALKGLFPEELDFKPHITLARVKYIGNAKYFSDSVSRICPANDIKKAKKVFAIDSFYLYKSILTSAGPVYEVIKKYDLSTEDH